MAEGIRIEWTSERSLRVQGVASTPSAVSALRELPGVLDVVPAEAAVFVRVDPLAGVAIDQIGNALGSVGKQADIEPRAHEIPVCYEHPYALDLAEVAEHAGISTSDVVELHASTEFTVKFLGFAPGFGYLGGLPDSLHVPRLASPRTRVEAGSVGIAGPYSGVYGLAGPGGWRIIGRTKTVMFGVERSEPALLRAGDVVRFRPVSLREFEA